MFGTPLSVEFRIIEDGEGAFPDLQQKQIAGLLVPSRIKAISALEGGMTSGKPSVMIRIDLEDGSVVLAETSMALFQMTARAFEARYGRVE